MMKVSWRGVVLVGTVLYLTIVAQGAYDPMCLQKDGHVEVTVWSQVALGNGSSSAPVFCLDEGTYVSPVLSLGTEVSLWGPVNGNATILCSQGGLLVLAPYGSLTLQQIVFVNCSKIVETNKNGMLLFVTNVVIRNAISFSDRALFHVDSTLPSFSFTNVSVTNMCDDKSPASSAIVVFLGRGGTANFVGCSFTNLVCQKTDAIVKIEGAASSSASVSIQDSVFSDNLLLESVLTLDSTFTSLVLNVSGSTFSNNSATTQQGAGILVQVQGSAAAGTISVESSLFAYNRFFGSGFCRFANVGSVSIRASNFTSNTVKANQGTASPGEIKGGGCLNINSVSLVEVSDTIMMLNRAESAHGGAVVVTSVLDVVLTNVQILGNFAGYQGGGVLFRPAESTTSRLTVNNSTVADNTGAQGGGGLFCDRFSVCTVSGTNLTANNGANGGAIVVFESTLDVTECVVTSNVAATVGGGLNCFSSTCVVSYSTFDSNSASSGGAMYALFTGAFLRIDNSYIARNTGGALLSFLADLFQVTDSVLLENVGGALQSTQSEVVLSGLIVHANQATSGGVIQVAGAANPVYVNDSFIGSNVGYGFACGSAVVHFHDTTLCNSAVANVLCEFNCTLSVTIANVIVQDNECPSSSQAAATITRDDSSLYFSRPCDEACSEDTVCVRPHFPFAGPFEGCFLCGSPCLDGGLNECAQAAVCEDMADSPFYNCSCITGYVGNGTDCQNFDECEASNGTLCIGESTCVDTDGSYFCDCPDGEISDANDNCVDKNECVASPCSGFATCDNVVGAPFFTCACNAGYYGDGFTCTACAANRTSAAGSTALDDCECDTETYPNMADVANFSLPCQACPPGYSIAGGLCAQCAVNTYSNSFNSLSCASCPSTYVSGPGSVSVAACQCRPGFVPDSDTASAACVIECEAGFYRVGETCVACGVGFYSNIPNLPGLPSGLSPCKKCPFGMVTATASATSLSECVCITNLAVPDDSPAYPFWQSFSFAPVDVTDSSDGCIIQCPVGSYRPGNESTECSPCPVNSYQDQTNQDNCAACPLASSTEGLLASTNVSACVCDSGFVYDAVEGCTRQCLPGTYYVSEEAPCVSCGANFWSPGNNALFCTACPANAVAPAASTTIEACECAVGYYTPSRATGTVCVACPVGGTCAGGVSSPIAEPGYTPVEDESGAVTFHECMPRSACGANGVCAVGYVGELCDECDPAYDQCAHEPDMERCSVVKYYRLNGVCKECSSNSSLVVVGVYCILLLVQVVLIWLNLQERTLNRFASLIISVNSLQLAAQYGRLDLEWPPLVSQFFEIVSIVNFNLELVAPECAVPVGHPFVLRWLGTMFFPVLLTANFALLYGLGHGAYLVLQRAGSGLVERLPTPRSLRHTAIRSLYQLIMIAYLPLSAATFELFDCPKNANGVRVVNVARDMECFTGVYWVLLPFGAVFVVLYPLGLPLLYYRLLKMKLASLGPVKFYIRYGFLVGRFSENFYLFELVIMARKLGVVLAMSFLTASPYVKAGGAALVLQLAFWLHLEAFPYRSLLYNVMDAVGLLCSILILILSVLFDERAFAETARDGTVLSLLCILVVTMVVGVALDSYYTALAAYSDRSPSSSSFSPGGEAESDKAARAATSASDPAFHPVLSFEVSRKSSLTLAEGPSSGVAMSDLGRGGVGGGGGGGLEEEAKTSGLYDSFGSGTHSPVFSGSVGDSVYGGGE